MYRIQDIMRGYAADHLIDPRNKVMSDICHCRTEKMGGLILKCEECGHESYYYRSCGNRHCPQCQGMKQRIWVENRKSEALDLPYYHVVFTVPDILNPVFLSDQRTMYEVMFRSVSETLLQLGEDNRWLGGKIGFLCVLHTWGSNLSLHPHLHVILVGKGIRNGKLVDPKNDGFLFPVHVMSKVFRGKFIDLMRKKDVAVPNGVYDTDWVVYIKETGSDEHIVKYLGRYTHRVAISDSRIVNITDSDVTFSYKDYRDEQIKQMTLSRDEFVRRFMLHVLPRGFCKIRYYGFLANRCKNKYLVMIRNLLHSDVRVNRFAGKAWRDIYVLLYGPSVCPCCGSYKLTRIDIKKPFHRIE